MKAKDFLIEKRACLPAVDWVRDMTIEQAYYACYRGDWLLWMFQRTNPDDLPLLTLAKGYCANTVRHLMQDDRSIRAVDSAIAFGEGRISREELKVASRAAEDAAAASAASATDAAASAGGGAH